MASPETPRTSGENRAPQRTRRQWRLSAIPRLAIYFALVCALATVAVKMGYDGTVENTQRWLSGGGNFSGSNGGGGGANNGGGGGKSEMLSEATGAPTSIRAAVHEFLVASATAIAFAIPVSITYTLTRRKEGYERSVVQMLIVLPVLVAAIVLVVRGSLALAFTLGGIVAVVRFRATFRDVKDAVFGFAVLAIGLAAGIHSIVIAAGMSLVFCTVAIVLWKMDVGDIRKDLARIEGDVPLSDALVPVGNGDALVRGKPEAAMNGHTQDLAEEAARLERIIQSDADSHKKKSRFTHLLLVHTNKVKPTRDTVEGLLDDSAKRWRFVSEVPYNNGTRTLEFLARLRQGANESRLLSAIQKEKEVVGVELKAVGAMRDAVNA